MTTTDLKLDAVIRAETRTLRIVLWFLSPILLPGQASPKSFEHKKFITNLLSHEMQLCVITFIVLNTSHSLRRSGYSIARVAGLYNSIMGNGNTDWLCRGIKVLEKGCVIFSMAGIVLASFIAL